MNDSPSPPDLVSIARSQELSHARSSAKTLASSLKGRQVFVRRTSIWQNPDAANAVTPTFPYLLHGSGSSGMSLKLYLLLLWQAGSDATPSRFLRRDAHTDRLEGAHTAALDYEQIADLMMISDVRRASSSGVRRITSTLRNLRDVGLIDLHDDARSIRLLSETRDGNAYTHPPTANKTAEDGRDRWVALPKEFFTCGWFTALSPQAILALLIHLWHWNENNPKSQSFNSEVLSKYAPVSKSTMTRGERLLTRWSVLTMTDQRYSGPKHRSRHVYRMQLDRLKQDCPEEVPPTFR